MEANVKFTVTCLEAEEVIDLLKILGSHRELSCELSTTQEGFRCDVETTCNVAAADIARYVGDPTAKDEEE